MTRDADLEGVFELRRATPARSGYRPGHKLYDNYISSGQHRYIGREWVEPGERAAVQVWLLTPQVYPASVWVGRVIEVCEGARVVGTLQVTRVRNPLLLGDPATVGRLWVEPAGLAETLATTRIGPWPGEG